MINASIVGSSGYTGLQLVNILKAHPSVKINKLLANSYAGQSYDQVFPSSKEIVDQVCEEMDLPKLSRENDVIFLALPHGIASKVISKDIIESCKIIDLGADFRLKDIDIYEQWYKTEHFSEDLLPESVYGLCEWNRNKIKESALIANPGCYTTASILSLLPVIKNNLIDLSTIVIDAKSGVSGAGRRASLATQFCECNESIKAYSVAAHRHTPEIEQELNLYSDSTDIKITFTPHLVPMNRGILTVSYANILSGVTFDQIKDAFNQYYQDEYFIRLRDQNDLPQTNYVKGTNYFDLSFVLDERTNRLIIIGALDNLMKGASSQAVQNMNICFGLEEKSGIDMYPMYI